MRTLGWFATFLMFFAAILVLGYIAFFAPSSAPPREGAYGHVEIENFTLSNGLEVILIPNDRVPAVSHMLWVRVGAADDPPGKSGLAHYHEHLMFKGTPTVPEGEYSRRLAALGGEFNAFTGSDFTGYYVNIAREHLPLVMELEADRMRHLAPSADAYATELNVIIEERESRVENNPIAQWGEQMQAALFHHHPYRIPIIGWMHEIRTLTPEDTRRFHQRWYQAPNMVLVVAGDITRAELEPLAGRYYAALPADAAPPRDWLQEPPARAARKVTMTHPEVKQHRWQRHYLAPSHGEGDAKQVMPLALLAEWLGGGQTGLLYETLVRDRQLATSASASYSGLKRGPAQLVLSVTPAPGVGFDALETAIGDLLQQVRSRPIAPEELARIKTVFKASGIYARDGLEPLAHYAGYLAMLGLPMTYLTEWEARVEAVTAAQIQDAARAVLRVEASVTGYLSPQAQPAEADTQPAQTDMEAGNAAD